MNSGILYCYDTINVKEIQTIKYVMLQLISNDGNHKLCTLDELMFEGKFIRMQIFLYHTCAMYM